MVLNCVLAKKSDEAAAGDGAEAEWTCLVIRLWIIRTFKNLYI